MSRRDRRSKGNGGGRYVDRNAAVRHAFRLIYGEGKRGKKAHAAVRADGTPEIVTDDTKSPQQKFSEYMGLTLATYDSWEKAAAEDKRCSEMDKATLLMRVVCNRLIKLGVSLDDFIQGMQVVYEQQEDQLRNEPPPDPPGSAG